MADTIIDEDGVEVPVVVTEAHGVAFSQGAQIDDPEGVSAKEARMVSAIEQAAADGVTDPDAIRERILAARDADA